MQTSIKAEKTKDLILEELTKLDDLTLSSLFADFRDHLIKNATTSDQEDAINFLDEVAACFKCSHHERLDSGYNTDFQEHNTLSKSILGVR